MKVLIIGGGIVGLCLAHGLERAGIDFTVCERDHDSDARLQGYRSNIEPIGSSAWHACLPGSLLDVLVATAGDPGPHMGVFDERLRQLMQEDEPAPQTREAELSSECGASFVGSRARSYMRALG